MSLFLKKRNIILKCTQKKRILMFFLTSKRKENKMLNYKESLETIMPYLIKIRDNCYEINKDAVINELTTKHMYREEYCQTIHFITLNQFKYNKDINIKSIIFILSLDVKTQDIQIIIKNDTIYATYKMESGSESRRFYIITDLLNNDNDLIVLYVYNPHDHKWYIDKQIFSEIVYRILTPKLDNIPCYHLNLLKNKLRYNNMFKFDILYMLYFLSIKPDSDKNLEYLMSSDDPYSEYIKYLNDLNRFIKIKCSYYNDVPNELIRMFNPNGNLHSLNIDSTKDNSTSIVLKFREISSDE